MQHSFLKIEVDGKAHTELSKDAILQSVEITQELNRHWWCKVQLRQTEDLRFPVEDCLGKDLKITASDENGRQIVLFDGIVHHAELEFEVTGSYTAWLRGVTRSYKLDQTPQETYFRKKDLKQIAEQLAGDDGLKASVNGPSKPTKNYVQWGQTDFDFLKQLADDYGCWLRPTKDGVEFYDAFQKGTELQWRGEDGLLKFKIEGRIGPPSFNGNMYNARTMESKTYKEVKKEAQFFGSSTKLVDAVKRESKNNLPPGYDYLDGRAPTPDEYKECLEHESVRSIGSRLTAWGVSRNAELLPGNAVTVKGVLDAEGEYGVTKVIHQWTGRGYRNEFWATPWKNYIDAKPPGKPPIHGVVSARVVDHHDPRRMGRVKVKYPWLEDGETGWARMVTPHAGEDRGFMFMPEIGDEVLVAFEHGDPERPIVIGALWNGVDHAPRDEFWGGDIEVNDVKRIVTKSGHRIQIIDKENKESIVIATPTKLKVSLIEKTDETNRSMITLHSEDGDIFLSAPKGRIHFHSKYYSREIGQ